MLIRERERERDRNIVMKLQMFIAGNLLGLANFASWFLEELAPD